MPLLLYCACGHSTALPEESGNYKCTRCNRSLELKWFDGPKCYEQWERWSRARRFLPTPPLRGSVKNVVTSQHDEPSRRS